MGTDGNGAGRQRAAGDCGSLHLSLPGTREGSPRRRPRRRGSGRSAGGTPQLRIELLEGFRLLDDGERIAVPPGSEQLLAFLALRRWPVRRTLMAGILWSQVPEERAAASLRAALSRLDPVSRSAITVSDLELSIAQNVAVDIWEARSLARGLLTKGRELLTESYGSAVTLLSHDLLPGWYHEWTLTEAAEWSQLRLYALEALACNLTGAHRFGEAAAAARAAIRMDPLRESATAALIRTHLAEGNQASAVGVLRRYEVLLRQELGFRPTGELYQLLAGAARGSREDVA